MCITESLCYSAEIGTALQINYTSIKKKYKKKKTQNKTEFFGGLTSHFAN